MKKEIPVGLTYELKYLVPENKTVPHLIPESSEIQQMPLVLATGFMIGLIEWACVLAVKPYLDWPDEQTVGISINVNHLAPTPPGMEVVFSVKVESVEGRKLVFSVSARDEVDKITEGTHERFIIDSKKFTERTLATKLAQVKK